MSQPRRTGVSYSRFSSPLQSEGDSEARQERDYKLFCERHNLTPGKEVFADRGRSGYHGVHRTKGRLGALIEAAKEGRFDPGTVIVIEAWDRLGRLRPDRQTELVSELLRTGVSIGVCRLDDIFSEEDFGTHKWTTLAVFIQLAHQESKQKADRVAASWEQRRLRARESGALVGSTIPAWIEVVDETPRLIPDRAATLERIFRLAADGYGHARIIRTLTAEKVPAFGAHAISHGRIRSQFAGKWSKSYIALLLRDRRVLGEMQLYKAGKPDGAPLTDYYPAAVTEELFTLARAAQEGRREYELDAKGRRKPVRDSKHVNVFQGLLRHARDGGTFGLHSLPGKRRTGPLALCDSEGKDGRAERCYTFPYAVFEEKVLELLKEIKPETVLPNPSADASTADTIRGNLKNCRDDLARIKADLRKDGYSKTLAELVRESEAREIELANQLQDELARIAKPLARSWNEVKTLADAIRLADDPDAARLKLRPTLRAIVEDATLLIVPSKSWRFAVLQFHFVGGARRHWVIAHQSAAHQREGKTWARSFLEIGLPGTDLREKGAWQQLEALLLKHATVIHEKEKREHAERKKQAARAKYAAEKAKQE